MSNTFIIKKPHSVVIVYILTKKIKKSRNIFPFFSFPLPGNLCGGECPPKAGEVITKKESGFPTEIKT